MDVGEVFARDGKLRVIIAEEGALHFEGLEIGPLGAGQIAVHHLRCSNVVEGDRDLRMSVPVTCFHEGQQLARKRLVLLVVVLIESDQLEERESFQLDRPGLGVGGFPGSHAPRASGTQHLLGERLRLGILRLGAQSRGNPVHDHRRLETLLAVDRTCVLESLARVFLGLVEVLHP